MTHLWFLLVFVFGLIQPVFAQSSRPEVLKAVQDSICPGLGTGKFKGCRPDQSVGGLAAEEDIVVTGEIVAGKRRFTILNYKFQDELQRDPESRPAPGCGVAILQRRGGGLTYMGHYETPCMTVRVVGNRVVFSNPPAKFDEVNFFVLDVKGPPPAIYIFGGYYTFFG